MAAGLFLQLFYYIYKKRQEQKAGEKTRTQN